MIRLLLQKQSEPGLLGLSRHFSRLLVFEILEHLLYLNMGCFLEKSLKIKFANMLKPLLKKEAFYISVMPLEYVRVHTGLKST